MKISILLISWSAICFAGTPWHETSVVRSRSISLSPFFSQKSFSVFNTKYYELCNSPLIFRLIQHCSFGCVLAQLPDQKEISICANMPFKLMPDTDNMYHIKIYSGFPVGQDHLQHTVPGYEQEYTWWDDYGQVMLDLSNCWKGSSEFLPPFIHPSPPPSFSFIVIYSLDFLRQIS